MAKAFQLSPARLKILERRRRREDVIVRSAGLELEGILRASTLAALQMAIEDARGGWDFSAPHVDLEPTFHKFYERTIWSGWSSAEEEHDFEIRKRAPRRMGAPGLKNPTLKELVDLFGNKREFKEKWSRRFKGVARRSNAFAKRMREAYLRKLRARFRQIVPRILDGSMTPAEAQARIKETWEVSRSRALNIFQTEVTTYFSEAQEAYYENSGDRIIGYLFDSLRDAARSEWCKSRHGLVYRPNTELLRKNKPSCHWRCRSSLIALADTPDNRRLLEDPARDPNKVRVVPLPRGWKR